MMDDGPAAAMSMMTPDEFVIVPDLVVSPP